MLDRWRLAPLDVMHGILKKEAYFAIGRALYLSISLHMSRTPFDQAEIQYKIATDVVLQPSQCIFSSSSSFPLSRSPLVPDPRSRTPKLTTSSTCTTNFGKPSLRESTSPREIKCLPPRKASLTWYVGSDFLNVPISMLLHKRRVWEMGLCVGGGCSKVGRFLSEKSH